MTNGSDKCKNCGGDRAIHHYQTDQCPIGGREAQTGIQEWKASTFEMEIPFDPPSRLASSMTLREYFAAMALTMWQIEQRDLQNLVDGIAPQHHLVANFCADVADALIEALNKTEDSK